MKRNFKLLITGLVAVFALHSCNDIYDAINLNEANSRIIVSSQMDYGNKVRVGGTITFGDISAGVSSRTWTFPAGAADIIGSDNDITATSENVKAQFNVPGVYDLKLNQIYKGDAYVTGSTTTKGNVLDTTIVVTVLPLITVQVKANYVNTDGTLGAPITLASGAKNQVIASRTVRYTITTEGEPEKFLWTVPGGTPATSDVVTKTLDVKYKKIGTYGFSVNANTARPAGTATAAYTDLIQVIPSTDPVTLDGAQVVSGDIKLNFSREMDPTSLNASDFVVKIINKGTTYPATIGSLSVDAVEGNLVVVKLSNQTLYNDDKVTISYTKGTMTTADAVAASSFSDVAVSFVGVNLLGKSPNAYDGAFETSATSNWQYLGWGAPWDKYTFAVTAAKAHTGTKSALVQIQPKGGMILGLKDNTNVNVTFNLTAGKTYEMGSWVYVNSLGDKTSVPDLRFYITPNTDWGIGPNPGFSATFTTGKWIYSSTLVKINATADYTFMIRGDNQGNSQALSFYIDDITVTEAKLRP